MSDSLINILPRLKPNGSEKIEALISASRPRVPQLHLFEAENGSYILVVDGTRIYRVSGGALSAIRDAANGRDPLLVDEKLDEFGLNATTYIDDEPLCAPPVRALSLAVAQKCNLGCVYCYAQGGNFGGAPKDMSEDVAMKSVELLFSQVGPGERVNLSFLGGEPLANRAVLRAATKRATELADSTRAQITFSITTNGTLLTPADGEFFEEHGFAVTVSLDGVGEAHDRLRPLKSGAGSYDRVIANVMPLLMAQRRMQVSARVTVTPLNLRLAETLDEFIDMGFHSVGFSPMLSSPTGHGELKASELEVMLEQMIACGERFELHTVEGRRYPFLNMVNAMREIHKGTHRPYPCGAGAGYLGVSAEGGLFACHRFVDDERAALGSVAGGLEAAKRKSWLAERHVHRQEPCASCWARYLCSGGCHHEVINRGRTACDYVRGWLHYCLGAYLRLSAHRPDYFGLPEQ